MKEELRSTKADSDKYRIFIKKDKRASYVYIDNGQVKGNF